jgi:hypothetical protein
LSLLKADSLDPGMERSQNFRPELFKKGGSMKRFAEKILAEPRAGAPELFVGLELVEHLPIKNLSSLSGFSLSAEIHLTITFRSFPASQGEFRNAIAFIGRLGLMDLDKFDAETINKTNPLLGNMEGA